MSCCGQKRQSWFNETKSYESEIAKPKFEIMNPVTIKYKGSESLLIKGNATGLVYMFAPHSSLLVDGRDELQFLINPDLFT